jgi:hypothetical protein
MNSSEKPRRMSMISSEALVGIGITIAGLGVLCLLLGCAEQMRSVPKIAFIWLALGAVLVIAGILTTLLARSKPDSYCNPRTQHRREGRAVLFASPLSGCKTGNEAP